MTSCIDLLISTARRLRTTIMLSEQAICWPTKEYGWENWHYRSPLFRLAHIEIFNQNKFCVVHCCVFPHGDDPAPIYGFDAIAGAGKITGVFMDLSPTAGITYPFTQLNVGAQRDRPEWGDIFSPHWMACRPSFQEMKLISDEADRVLKEYLPTLKQATGDRDAIVAGQNHYCHNQQKNPHTRKALERLLGEDGTEEFMTTMLFPKIT